MSIWLLYSCWARIKTDSSTAEKRWTDAIYNVVWKRNVEINQNYLSANELVLFQWLKWHVILIYGKWFSARFFLHSCHKNGFHANGSTKRESFKVVLLNREKTRYIVVIYSLKVQPLTRAVSSVLCVDVRKSCNSMLNSIQCFHNCENSLSLTSSTIFWSNDEWNDRNEVIINRTIFNSVMQWVGAMRSTMNTTFMKHFHSEFYEFMISQSPNKAFPQEKCSENSFKSLSFAPNIAALYKYSMKTFHQFHLNKLLYILIDNITKAIQAKIVGYNDEREIWTQ